MDYIQYTQTKCIHMHISYICVNYLLWGWVRLLVRAQTSQISNQIGTSYTICGIKKTYSDLFGIVSRNHVVVISLPKTDLAHKKKPWKKKSSLPLRVGFWTYRNTIGYNPYNNFSARVAFTCLDSSDLSRFNNPNPNLQKIIFPHSDARFLPMISLRPEISHSPVGSQSARHNSVVAKSFPPWKKKKWLKHPIQQLRKLGQLMTIAIQQLQFIILGRFIQGSICCYKLSGDTYPSTGQGTSPYPTKRESRKIIDSKVRHGIQEGNSR